MLILVVLLVHFVQRVLQRFPATIENVFRQKGAFGHQVPVQKVLQVHKELWQGDVLVVMKNSTRLVMMTFCVWTPLRHAGVC